MKLRTGFVSNSSSSSFLVCFKGDKLTKKKLTEVFGIQAGTAAEKFMSPFFDRLLKSKEHTEEYILENYGYDYREEAQNAGDSYCLKQLKLLDEGWRVGYLNVDYNEELLIEMLDNKVITDDFMIKRDN